MNYGLDHRGEWSARVRARLLFPWLIFIKLFPLARPSLEKKTFHQRASLWKLGSNRGSPESSRFRANLPLLRSARANSKEETSEIMAFSRDKRKLGLCAT